MRSRGVLGRPGPARRRVRHRLPPAPLGRARAATVIGVEPHPASSRSRGVVRVGSTTSRCAQGTAQALPLPDASVDVVHARWAYFFGPGCEPGLAELDRVVRRGGTAFVIDNDATRSTFGGVVPPRLPDGRPRRGRALLVGARLDPGAGRHGLVVRAPRADLEAVVRIEFAPEVAERVLAVARGHRGRLRGQPLVAGVLTPSPLSAAARRRTTGQEDSRTTSVGVSSTPSLGGRLVGRAGPRAR